MTSSSLRLVWPSPLAVPSSLRPAMELLLQGWNYAAECQSNPWQFAVGIGELRAVGLTTNDLRYLVSKGFAQQAVETTRPRSRQRVFGRTGSLLITEKSAFVLTDAGAQAARQLALKDYSVQTEVPYYDRELRELWLGKVLMKHFRQLAPDQHLILCSFQELGWPPRIDSPLSPHNFDEDPKLRLRRAIRRLNQHQINRLILFLADGTGEGICWQLYLQEALERRR